MADTKRININVDPGIKELLIELAGGERKIGDYVSKLVREAGIAKADQPVAVALERIEQKLDMLLEAQAAHANNQN